MRSLLAVLLVLATVLACAKDENRKPATFVPVHIAKIKVKRDGVILLNDKAVTIDVLKSSLRKLSQSAGAAVWYYRESPGGEPHPNAMLVLQAIVDAKLPIKLSTKPDFSDSVSLGKSGGPRR